MKIVLLTSRAHTALIDSLEQAFTAAALPITEVVCARRRSESVLRHWASNHRLVRRCLRKEQTAAASGKLRRRIFTQWFGSSTVVDYLRHLEPDLLINASGPLFTKEIIRTARIGLLNCHVGLLPEFRGMNVAEWSVLHGYPTGNTIHFIDSGIDTGGILAFYAVPMAEVRTVDAMRILLVARGAQHLVDTVRQLQDGELTPIPQQPHQGRQFFRMHPRLRARVEERLSRGYQPSVDISSRTYCLNPGRWP